MVKKKPVPFTINYKLSKKTPDIYDKFLKKKPDIYDQFSNSGLLIAM